jgi:hypothetical protein
MDLLFVPMESVDHSKSVERRKGENAQQNLIWLLLVPWRTLDSLSHRTNLRRDECI